MKFYRHKFFNGFKREFTPHLTQAQTDGLEFLITSFEQDPIWSDVRYIAYALATIFHETAYTFQPIQEYGSTAYFERRYGSHTKTGKQLGNDAPGEGAKYSGKGFVQLTGESNYEKLEQIIKTQNPEAVRAFEEQTGQKFDLTDAANQAKNPGIAFLIMTIGMFRGIYTGVAFHHFINDKETNYREARRIINSTDKQDLIANYAVRFEKILRASIVETTPENVSQQIDSISTVAPVAAESEAAEPKKGALQQAVGTPNAALGADSALNSEPPNEWKGQDDLRPAETTESGVGKTQETVSQTFDTPQGEVKKTVTEEKSTFNPQNLPAFIPRFGKQWFLGLIPGAGFLSTIAAKAASMPDWLVFLLGALTGIALWNFFTLITKHREKVLEFVTKCYEITANPQMNNLIPTNASGFVGLRKVEIEKALRANPLENSDSQPQMFAGVGR